HQRVLDVAGGPHLRIRLPAHQSYERARARLGDAAARSGPARTASIRRFLFRLFPAGRAHPAEAIDESALEAEPELYARHPVAALRRDRRRGAGAEAGASACADAGRAGRAGGLIAARWRASAA